jgi:type III secretion system (T3SS) inner membrane Yop/YscD-like protein/cysteine-rich secretory family protein
LDLILVDTRSGKRRSFPMSARPLMIGRSVDCDVVLPDATVPEHCCRLTEGGGSIALESLSNEGVTVNGFAVRAAEIHAGDVVRIGAFQIVFAANASLPAAPRAAAPAPAAPAAPTAPRAAAAPKPPASRPATPRPEAPRAAAPAPQAPRNAAPEAQAPRPADPRQVSKRRRPEKRSNLVPIVVASAILVVAAGGGIWFWKKNVAKPENSPVDVGAASKEHGENSTKSPSDPAAPPDPSDPAHAAPSSNGTHGTNGSDAGSGHGSDSAGSGRDAASTDKNAPPTAPTPGAGKDDAAGASDPNKPTPSEELWRTLERVGHLLEYEEYSRCRWLLSQQRPGTPKERTNVEAMQKKVDAAAQKGGDEYLKFVEKLIAKGWILPALNHLQDESIERFRGLPIWYTLTERADLLEDEVDKVVPDGRRPVARVKHSRPRPADVNSLPPPPIGVTDTEREMDGTTAANRAAPSSGATTAAATPQPPVRVTDPLSEARRSLESLRFDEAAVLLETMPRSQLSNEREAKRQRMASWAAAAKRSSGGGTTVQPPSQNSGLDEKAAKESLAAARLKEHPPREWLDVAWFALAVKDDAAFDDALVKAAPDAALKDEIDSALAFHRGLDGVPAGGFTCVDGRWLTAAERDSAAARAALDAAMTALLNAKEGAVRDATARLVEASKSSPATAAEILKARCTELSGKMASASEKAGLDALRARVQSLSDARVSVLTFAFDDASYPPDAALDANAIKKLADANKELDKRVSAVRAIWGNEQGSAPEPCVDLSDDYAALVRQAHALESALAAIHAAAPEDAEFGSARLLPGFTAKVTVRNCALSADERRRIDADREVKARNQVAKETKNSAELELLNLINSYREMLGVPQVAFDAKLYGDAHAYSEVMSVQTKKERDDAPQPEQKLATEKPKLTPGELYLRGKFSARQALGAWLHIAASHRNILFSRHKSVGPANVGNFWTCTFGLTEPEAK